MNTLPEENDEVDDDTTDWPDDTKAISNMISVAAEAEMLLEVIGTFGEMMASGETVVEAVREALYEWDL